MRNPAQTRPYVVCHMLTSLDGKIDGAYMSDPACSSALNAYGTLRGRFSCKATIYGTTTMAGGFADGYVGSLPNSTEVYPREDFIANSKARSYIVSADPEGVLGFHANTITRKDRPEAHVVEVLTDTVSNDYLSYLRGLGISYIFAGSKHLDCKRMLEKLYRLFAIDKLLLAGGGLMNWSLARENVIDELSLVIAPVADGSTTAVSIFERAEFLPSGAPVAFQFRSAEPLDGGALWLRYQRKEAETP